MNDMLIYILEGLYLDKIRIDSSRSFVIVLNFKFFFF